MPKSYIEETNVIICSTDIKQQWNIIDDLIGEKSENGGGIIEMPGARGVVSNNFEIGR